MWKIPWPAKGFEIAPDRAVRIVTNRHIWLEAAILEDGFQTDMCLDLLVIRLIPNRNPTGSYQGREQAIFQPRDVPAVPRTSKNSVLNASLRIARLRVDEAPNVAGVPEVPA